MALNANSLKTEWANNLPDIEEPSIALLTWANVTAQYLIDNTEIIFAWTAFSGPTPDPVVVTTGGIETLTFSLSLSNAEEYNPAINHFKSELISSLSIGTYNITAPGWTTAPNVFSTSPTISNLDLDLSSVDQNVDDVHLEFAQRIIDWVTGQAPVGPCAGSHGAYTGSGIVTSIF